MAKAKKKTPSKTTIGTNVTLEQAEAIRAATKALGLSPYQWIRQVLLDLVDGRLPTAPAVGDGAVLILGVYLSKPDCAGVLARQCLSCDTLVVLRALQWTSDQCSSALKDCRELIEPHIEQQVPVFVELAADGYEPNTPDDDPQPPELVRVFKRWEEMCERTKASFCPRDMPTLPPKWKTEARLGAWSPKSRVDAAASILVRTCDFNDLAHGLDLPEPARRTRAAGVDATEQPDDQVRDLEAQVAGLEERNTRQAGRIQSLQKELEIRTNSERKYRKERDELQATHNELTNDETDLDHARLAGELNRATSLAHNERQRRIQAEQEYSDLKEEYHRLLERGQFKAEVQHAEDSASYDFALTQQNFAREFADVALGALIVLLGDARKTRVTVDPSAVRADIEGLKATLGDLRKAAS